MILDKELIRNNLSNFYSEYGYSDFDIDFFLDLYEETGSAIEQYMYSTKRNQTIKTMEAFKKFNFAVFGGHPACYVVSDLLASKLNSDFLGISGDLASKLAAWDSTVTKAEKISMLDKLGYYIELSAKRALDATNPEVVYLDLADLYKVTLVLNRDYYMDNNKIYLINDLAVASFRNSSLVATNIFVDYKTPEKLVGSRIGLGYNDNVTEVEYRDFVQMVAYVLMKGPTIKNIRDAFNILAGWEGSNIVDMISATGVRKDMWYNPTTAILTPFDFLLTIPAAVASTVGVDEATGDLIVKDDRISIFSRFLDVVKPVDTDYIIALSENVAELLNPADPMTIDISMDLEEDNDVNEEISFVTSTSIEEEFSHGLLGRKISYDDSQQYDDLKTYDEDELIYVGPGETYGDIVTLRAIDYPEFPINFNAIKDILLGDVDVSFTDNAQNVDEYDILRNNDVIHTISSNGDLSTINWKDTEIAGLGSGTYIYYARSVYYIGVDKNYSRPSKKITIIK